MPTNGRSLKVKSARRVAILRSCAVGVFSWSLAPSGGLRPRFTAVWLCCCRRTKAATANLRRQPACCAVVRCWMLRLCLQRVSSLVFLKPPPEPHSSSINDAIATQHSSSLNHQSTSESCPASTQASGNRTKNWWRANGLDSNNETKVLIGLHDVGKDVLVEGCRMHPARWSKHPNATGRANAASDTRKTESC